MNRKTKKNLCEKCKAMVRKADAEYMKIYRKKKVDNVTKVS